MMRKEFITALEDVALIRRGDKIRHWLSEICGMIPRLNEDPVPSNPGTQQGLALICGYGSPVSLATPFGTWNITGGGSLKNWEHEAIGRLGMVQIHSDYDTEEGSYGPVYAISRDLDGIDLPTTVWESRYGVHGVPSITPHNTRIEDLAFEYIKSLREIPTKRISLFNFGKEEIPQTRLHRWEDFYRGFIDAKWAAIKLKLNIRSWLDLFDSDYYALHDFSGDAVKQFNAPSDYQSYLVYSFDHELKYTVLCRHHVAKFIYDADGNYVGRDSPKTLQLVTLLKPAKVVLNEN